METNKTHKSHQEEPVISTSATHAQLRQQMVGKLGAPHGWEWGPTGRLTSWQGPCGDGAYLEWEAGLESIQVQDAKSPLMSFLSLSAICER